MKSDVMVRVEAMNVLIQGLGEVDAERFITIIKQDDEFDYTEWRKPILEDRSIDEIYNLASEAYEQKFAN